MGLDDEIRARVHGLVAKWAADGSVITAGARFDDLGLKTLEVLQVIMDCEDAWDGLVFITDEEAEAIRTVGDLERLVIDKVRNPERQPA